jgi:hypothetical protein
MKLVMFSYDLIGILSAILKSNTMKDNTLRSIAATALLVIGLTKASSKIERALAPKGATPEGPTSFCIPCYYSE